MDEVRSPRNTPVMPTIASKDAANYTTNGSPEEHCAICRYWTMQPSPSDEGLCLIVSGTISPLGWCRYFEHLAETGERA